MAKTTSSYTSSGARASKRALIAVALASLVAVTGCQTLQKIQANPFVQQAEKLGWNVAINAATTYATGGQINAAWAAPVALNSLSELIKTTTSNQQAAALIDATTQQFVNDPKFAHIGKDLAKAFVAANPQTPAQKSAVVVALATGASNGLSASSPQH